jgi:hypothetical protein
MANLQPCPTCKQSISVEANPCPHCGQPDPFKPRSPAEEDRAKREAALEARFGALPKRRVGSGIAPGNEQAQRQAALIERFGETKATRPTINAQPEFDTDAQEELGGGDDDVADYQELTRTRPTKVIAVWAVAGACLVMAFVILFLWGWTGGLKPTKEEARRLVQQAIGESGTSAEITYRGPGGAVRMTQEMWCFQSRGLINPGTVFRRGGGLHRKITVTPAGRNEGITTPGEDEVTISWGRPSIQTNISIGRPEPPSKQVDLTFQWSYRRTISDPLYRECFLGLGNDLTVQEAIQRNGTVTVCKEEGVWLVESSRFH